MTCRCGAHMCYICRQPITDYQHFCQHAHNPGRGCPEKCGRCLTFTNTEQDDGLAVEEVRRIAERDLDAAQAAVAAGISGAAGASPAAPRQVAPAAAAPVRPAVPPPAPALQRPPPPAAPARPLPAPALQRPPPPPAPARPLPAPALQRPPPPAAPAQPPPPPAAPARPAAPMPARPAAVPQARAQARVLIGHTHRMPLSSTGPAARVVVAPPHAALRRAGSVGDPPQPGGMRIPPEAVAAAIARNLDIVRGQNGELYALPKRPPAGVAPAGGAPAGANPLNGAPAGANPLNDGS